MIDLRHVQVSNLYFRLMWIIALLLYILIPFGSGILSSLYLGIIAITVILFVCSEALLFRKNFSKFDSRIILLFSLIVLELLVSAGLGTGETPIKDVFIGAMGYLEMLMALMILHRLKYTYKNIKFLLHINIVIAVLFTALSFSGFAYSGRLPLLYLGYSNPNTTAIYLLLNQSILIIFLRNIRQWWLKLLVTVLCVYEVYLLFLTGSRTCLLASILIIAFYLSGKKFHIPRIVIIVAILFPLAFVWIYTGLYASGQYIDKVFLGKELFSGREQLFYEIFSNISGSLAFGDVTQYAFTNAHNAPLTIIASVGVVGYVLYFLYYSNFIFSYYKKNSSIQQNIALVTIMATFLHSASEAVLMVGGAQYSIIVATLYWILKGAAKDEKEMI